MKYVKMFSWGILWDMLLTLDTLFLTRRWITSLGVITFVIVVFTFKLYNKVIKDDDLQWDLLIPLALGSAISAALTTYFFKATFDNAGG